ncbi:MAG: type II secretion system F family protein [Deltaproteobacteria bacterium]|nr:type II secretion system F family protein [Deltaproteobacteria bacterium]
MLIREKEIFFEKVLILLNAKFSISKIASYILDKKNELARKETAVASAISEGQTFYSAVKKEFILSDIEEVLISKAETEKELKHILYNLKKFKNKTARLLLQSGLFFFLIGIIITAVYRIFRAVLYNIIPNIVQYLPELINEKITFILTNIKKILPLLLNGGLIIMSFLLIVALINPISCDKFFISWNISIAKVRKYFLLNRFFRKLSLFCSNGINLKEAFSIVWINEKNYFQIVIKEVYNSVISGKRLDKAFEDTKKDFFPAYSIRIMADTDGSTADGKNFQQIASLLETDFYNAGNKLIINFIMAAASFIIFFIISVFLLGLFLSLIKIL